jgi:pSer/pThr/pTyr-binding forkhead associated (FHA) protein
MNEWIISLNDKVIKRFIIKEGWKLIIGRGANADVIVDNTAISREHTSIELKDGLYILSDLGSLNGTFVNGKKIKGTEYITQEDDIKLGKFKLSVGKGSEQELTSSYGAHPDTDDKTIIVNSKQLSAMAEDPDEKKPEHQLILMEGNAAPSKISLKGKSSIKIGKALSCDMVLSGLFIADAQFYIVQHKDKYKIIPQRSWAKTFLNGTKIKDEKLLKKGDIIKIRSTKIRFY